GGLIEYGDTNRIFSGLFSRTGAPSPFPCSLLPASSFLFPANTSRKTEGRICCNTATSVTRERIHVRLRQASASRRQRRACRNAPSEVRFSVSRPTQHSTMCP